MNCSMAMSMALYLAAIAFALVAETIVSKKSASVVIDPSSGTAYCHLSMDEAAFICGIVALCLLLSAQLVMAITSSCICCAWAPVMKKPGKTKIAAIGLFALSWMFCTLAAIALVIASVLTALTKEERGAIVSGTAFHVGCGERARKGTFGLAAALVVLTLICTECFLALEYRARRHHQLHA